MEKCEAIFTSRLRLRMMQQRISQTQLAKEISIEPAMITRYLHGKCMPNMRVLWRICRVLDCSADYLLGNSEYCFTADRLINSMK